MGFMGRMSRKYPSLPVLGVWIEIVGDNAQAKGDTCHSLYWGCGLKFQWHHLGIQAYPSLPVLGVWIEIGNGEDGGYIIPVTPCIGGVD